MWCENSPLAIKQDDETSSSSCEDGDNFSKCMDEILVSTNSWQHKICKQFYVLPVPIATANLHKQIFPPIGKPVGC